MSMILFTTGHIIYRSIEIIFNVSKVNLEKDGLHFSTFNSKGIEREIFIPNEVFNKALLLKNGNVVSTLQK